MGNFFQAHWVVLLATATTVVYCANGALKNKLGQRSFFDIFSTLLFAASLLSGLKLSINSIADNFDAFEHFEDSKVFYTVIGGFAIAWLALWEFIKRFKELDKDD